MVVCVGGGGGWVMVVSTQRRKSAKIKEKVGKKSVKIKIKKSRHLLANKNRKTTALKKKVILCEMNKCYGESKCIFHI